MRGRSSVWLERRPVKPEVASSSLVGPAIDWKPPEWEAFFMYQGSVLS